MRGKRPVIHYLLLLAGITPADAGKTYRREMKKKELRDHPRGCGENHRGLYLLTTLLGSPPRMRGKLRYTVQRDEDCRITPADAGKTF